MREEKLFSNLGEICEPKANISPVREKYKWNSLPYETAKVTGSMLVSLQDGRPEDVSFDPELTGWYRIFVCLGAYPGVSVNVSLSGDDTYTTMSPSAHSGYGYHAVEESFWTCADMTGQKFCVSKRKHGIDYNAMLAWVRFVPMDEAEVTAWHAEEERKDTKRLYATDDMHNRLYMGCCETKEDWRALVRHYKHSDVEWLSMEDVLTFVDSDCFTGNTDNFVFCRQGDRFVQENRPRYNEDMLRDLVSYGHEQGLKMCASLRMGAWGMEFPYDQIYFECRFTNSHPELRCVDRDGTFIDALSYAYPEVQDFMINQLVWLAGLGFDAVEMIFTRGIPYVLFEEPVLKRFRAEYGFDPRELPLDDERLNKVHREIMTEFVKKLRAALNEVRSDKRIGLHARILFSLYDSAYVGLDVEEWAKQGLITGIISYPQRFRELLEGDIWQDGDEKRIDLGKYAEYVRMSPTRPTSRQGDFNFIGPVEDSRGVMRGPASQEERVSELMALEEKYGVRVYIEIMPRYMSTEAYRDRALELYRAGCRGISLWDTYDRVPVRAEWSMVRRLGHIEELPGYNSGEGEWYTATRLLKIGGRDVSRYIPAWGG